MIERNIGLTLRFEVFLVLIVVGIIISKFGFPILEMLSGQATISQLNERLVDLPFGILGILVWLSFVIAVKFSIISNIKIFDKNIRRLSMIAVALAIFASILYGKRQVVLAVIFFYTLMLLLCTPLSRKLIMRIVWALMIFLIFFVLYISIQFIRTNGTGDGTGEIFLLELPLSIVWPLLNFDRLIVFYHPDNHLVGLISQIIPNRMLGHNLADVLDILFEPTSSTGLLFYAYQDFGATGVLAASFVAGVMIRIASKDWNGLITNLGTKLLCLWACITVAFYSHIISVNFFLLPILIIAIVNGINGTRKLG